LKDRRPNNLFSDEGQYVAEVCFLSIKCILGTSFNMLAKSDRGHSSAMTVDLVHSRETLKVSVRTLVMKSHRFTDNPRLVDAPYAVLALSDSIFTLQYDQGNDPFPPMRMAFPTYHGRSTDQDFTLRASL
jgi:hypothetical protein